MNEYVLIPFFGCIRIATHATDRDISLVRDRQKGDDLLKNRIMRIGEDNPGFIGHPEKQAYLVLGWL